MIWGLQCIAKCAFAVHIQSIIYRVILTIVKYFIMHILRLCRIKTNLKRINCPKDKQNDENAQNGWAERFNSLCVE